MWLVVWYNLTVTGVVGVGVSFSGFLGDFCYYGNIPYQHFFYKIVSPGASVFKMPLGKTSDFRLTPYLLVLSAFANSLEPDQAKISGLF